MNDLITKYGNKFKKDVDKLKKQNKNMKLLAEVLKKLQKQLPLEREYKDHPLKGKLKDYRDLHIEPDWLLIYRIDNEGLFLYRTGSHSDLF